MEWCCAGLGGCLNADDYTPSNHISRNKQRSAHRVALGIHPRRPPAQAAEPLWCRHRRARQLQLAAAIGKVELEDLQDVGATGAQCLQGEFRAGDKDLVAAVSGQTAGGGGEDQDCTAERTSSCDVLVKDRSMAPATLPAARKGPDGQNERVALRCACLSTVIALWFALHGPTADSQRPLSTQGEASH